MDLYLAAGVDRHLDLRMRVDDPDVPQIRLDEEWYLRTVEVDTI